VDADWSKLRGPLDLQVEVIYQQIRITPYCSAHIYSVLYIAKLDGQRTTAI
jgi:archaellum component FlaD/FlaE